MNYRRSTLISTDSLQAPPRHSLLSGRYKESWAFVTLSKRMPGIMQQICLQLVDNLYELIEEYGEEVRKDVDNIVEHIERLKRDLSLDGRFKFFQGEEPDKDEWNAFLLELPRHKSTFFGGSWLHCECYIYRRMQSFFMNSRLLKEFDYFGQLKRDDLMISTRAMQAMALATRNLERSWKNFRSMMRINLWSLRFEMQLKFFSKKLDDPENVSLDLLAQVALLDKRLLIDETAAVWNCLRKAKLRNLNEIVVEFICDNAGFELFTDLLFIEFLIRTGMATKVRMHVKAIPWYISDVTETDIEWTINYLMRHEFDCLSELGRNWAQLMRERRIEIAPKSYFWTGPQPYFVMVDFDLELFQQLSSSELAIFKGDLNYRKLLGDYIWDPTEEFITCLRGFRPCDMCALRTVKCEVICGLNEGTIDTLLRTDPQWMISGSYGVIQYTDCLKCSCCYKPNQPTQPCQKEETNGKKYRC